jgi:uncharacterized protein (TIGR02594 family)
MNDLLELAKTQLGVKEIAGEDDNQTIVGYAKESGFPWVNDDETPWCSIFSNWVCLKASYERSKKANARSWLNVGLPIEVPEYGCICVFKRENSTWKGHVGFFDGEDKTHIYVCGGNQGNSVSIKRYPKTDLLGYRRLTKIKTEPSPTR